MMLNERVHELLWGDSDSLATNFLNQHDEKFDEEYTGLIVDNNDPEKLGRCKIKVYGVFDEVDTKDLPWALPDFSFVGSLVGSFIVPPIGCIVRVSFENGELYFPKYSKKVVNKQKLPKNKDKNYPNNMIFFETDKGTSFEIDRTTDETVFTHAKGLQVTIDALGIATITPNNLFILKGSTVVPDTLGPFNCIGVCPLTKQPHAGTISNPPIGI